MSEPQTLANHRRIDPAFHMLLFGIVAVNFFYCAYLLFHDHSFAAVWRLVMAFAFLLLTFKLRLYALRNQDRIIRLEERLRMERLLPSELKSRIPELRESQLVGLRFASDAELADRVQEALDQKLGNEDIKKRVQSWRPDEFRV